MSELRNTANQANARLSTGPKTPEGKAAVRHNAVRHGLLARDVVIPGEDAEAFEDFWNEVRAQFSPVGPIEEFLVERVVNSMWRLRRLMRAETALFHSYVYNCKLAGLQKAVRSYEKTVIEGIPKGVSFSTKITDEAAYTEAVEALEQAENERDRDQLLLGYMFSAEATDAFDKIARYERSLERTLSRTLDQLRQLQDQRRNRPSSSISDAITLDCEDTE
jgi:hypothetical protein